MLSRGEKRNGVPGADDVSEIGMGIGTCIDVPYRLMLPGLVPEKISISEFRHTIYKSGLAEINEFSWFPSANRASIGELFDSDLFRGDERLLQSRKQSETRDGRLWERSSRKVEALLLRGPHNKERWNTRSTVASLLILTTCLSFQASNTRPKEFGALEFSAGNGKMSFYIVMVSARGACPYLLIQTKQQPLVLRDEALRLEYYHSYFVQNWLALATLRSKQKIPKSHCLRVASSVVARELLAKRP
ncbi:hypothetical protein L6452_42101 [Arctium lappa]|uniref:Uncharacterized protein n=1 Tax=Arctium lappa TaxID=4217 RepID=A0ACB8XHT9_ARCLA|nr:hypothetical protein L6452_42101 [Arctium lappa]